MENSLLLSKINSVSESFDPKLFVDLINTVQELIKNEKQKQELKEIIDDVIAGLISISYDVEDEKIESDFNSLLEELVKIGLDIGKTLIKDLLRINHSEQLVKVICMLETILKASSWIRKISLAQKLAPVIQQKLSQNLPIRIKEMLNKLNQMTLPYQKKNLKNNSLQASSTLHSDKSLIIQEWLKFPQIFVNLDPVMIQGMSILDFLTREVNFEIVLDYILFSQELGEKVLGTITQISPHFRKFKKFNPEKKITECVQAAITSNSSEFTVTQSIKLLKVLICDKNSSIINYLITGSTIMILLKNLQYSEVRSFLFVHILANNTFSQEVQSVIKNSVLREIFRRFCEILNTGTFVEIANVIEMMSLLMPEILCEGVMPRADEFECGTYLKLGRYKKTLLTSEGHSLISAIFQVSFREMWTSETSKELQELQIMSVDLVVNLIKSSKNCKPIFSVVNQTVDSNYLQKIQSNILHYSLNNTKETFRLPCILVTRPVGTHMIQLSRIFTEVLNFRKDLIKTVSTNCWSTFFLWFFVFKNNGIILNLIYTSIELFLEYGEEKRIKEVLMDKKFLARIVEALNAKSSLEEKDFFFCCKKIGKKIGEYAESHKSKFSKDILNMPTWKTLFPQVQETILKQRPKTRTNIRGHTFILGIDPLEKTTPKVIVKQEHEVQHLSSQLDLIFKVNKADI